VKQKKRLVIIYSRQFTDAELQKYVAKHGDYKSPAVTVNGLQFDAEQTFIKYPSVKCGPMNCP